MNTTSPAILSRHNVGPVTITRFRSRSGDVEWFIEDADTSLAQHERDLFQGERAAAKRWLRLHWPVVKAGRRPRPSTSDRKAWLPDGWKV